MYIYMYIYIYVYIYIYIYVYVNRGLPALIATLEMRGLHLKVRIRVVPILRCRLRRYICIYYIYYIYIYICLYIIYMYIYVSSQKDERISKDDQEGHKEITNDIEKKYRQKITEDKYNADDRYIRQNTSTDNQEPPRYVN
jgi:hypothetical protein